MKNLEEDLKGVELNQPPPIATRPEKTKSIYTAPVDEEESDPNALKVPNLAKETISENSTNTGNLFWVCHIFKTNMDLTFALTYHMHTNLSLKSK